MALGYPEVSRLFIVIDRSGPTGGGGVGERVIQSRVLTTGLSGVGKASVIGNCACEVRTRSIQMSSAGGISVVSLEERMTNLEVMCGRTEAREEIRTANRRTAERRSSRTRVPWNPSSCHCDAGARRDPPLSGTVDVVHELNRHCFT